MSTFPSVSKLSLLLAALAPAAAMWPPPQDVRSLLAASYDLPASAEGTGGLEALAQRLVELGPGALPALLGTIARDAVLLDGGASVPLDPRRLEAILHAVELLPRSEVRASLARIAGGEFEARERRAALLALGRTGGRHDLELAIELATPNDERAAVPIAVRDALGEALAGLLARDPSLVVLLRATFDRAHAALRARLVEAVSATGTSEGLEALGGLLGRDPGTDPVILVEIARLGESVAHPVPSGVVEEVREHLSDPDPRRAQLAVLALGALEDHDSLPALLVLLEDSDRDLRAAALSALRAITGLGLRAEPVRWRAWYEQELAWWRADAPRVQAELESRDSFVAAAAIVELSHHRLYRHELAAALRGALVGQSAELRVVACGVAADLGSAALLPDLVDLLLDGDQSVRAAAFAALRRLTGKDLPPDAEAWAGLLR